MDHVLGVKRADVQALAPPPRRVPFRVVLGLWFSGTMGQIGWFFIAFGSIFVWAFGGLGLIQSLKTSPFDSFAAGRITEIRTTGAEINGESVRKLIFEYTVNGDRHVGDSYTTSYAYDKGQEITVEYVSSAPKESRVEGTRNFTFPWFVPVLCGIFPLIGFFFALYRFRKGRRAQHLLSEGLLAMGTLARKDPTNTRVNEQMVYKLTFNFTTEDGMVHHAIARTHQTARLEDEQEEPVLYLRQSPAEAILLDEWASVTNVTPEGHFEPLRGSTGIVSSIIPMIGIGMNLTMVLIGLL